MEIRDKQGGGWWEISAPRWVASWRKIPLSLSLRVLPDGGLSPGALEMIILLPMLALAAVLFVLSVAEFLVHLLLTPVRYLIQPSARRAGWAFDIIRYERSETGSAAGLKNFITRIVTISVWTPTRSAARTLRMRLRQLLRADASLTDTAVMQTLTALGAKVTMHNIEEFVPGTRRR